METCQTNADSLDEIIKYIMSNRHRLKIFEEIGRANNLRTVDLLMRVVQNSALIIETTRKLAATALITRGKIREGRKQENFIVRYNITPRGREALKKILAMRKKPNASAEIVFNASAIQILCGKNPDARNFLRALRHQSLKRSVLMNRYGNFGGPKQMADTLKHYGAVILRQDGSQWFYDLTERARDLPFLK